MYIDFEELRPETPRVERALSVREGVLISIIVHLLLFIGILFLPDLPQAQAGAGGRHSIRLRGNRRGSCSCSRASTSRSRSPGPTSKRRIRIA